MQARRSRNGPDFALSLTQAGSDDLLAAQRLRYEVFVEELGAGGSLVDHAQRLERDAYDSHFDHLILRDRAREDAPVVGVYRVMRDDQARAAGKFYSEDEYDLAPLRATGRKLLELGRSCVHRDYRGGTAMMELWRGLAAYIEAHEIEILFGVASFHGTEIAPLAPALSLLHHRHLAPEELRPRALSGAFQRMDLMAESEINRVAAMKATPSLIKAYLRLGGFVGEGAFIDREFNTVDVCLVMDTARMSARHRAIYAGLDGQGPSP